MVKDAVRRQSEAGIEGPVDISVLIMARATDAAHKISALDTVLWLAFHSDALVIVEEVRSRQLFVQPARLDLCMVESELRAATHEKMMMDMWNVLQKMS